MIRKIIKIDEEKCNGCGACASACHEGAIGMINGKAKLLRDDYCDGLGDCLPACPTGAISFEEREAAEYDRAAVLEKMNRDGIDPAKDKSCESLDEAEKKAPDSELAQWPCQIKLMPINAPYFDGANLLIAADCTAYAYSRLHEDFMKGRITLIGCPKLDSTDYSEKLAQILKNNSIQSVTVVRMEVPCCRGLELAVKRALDESGKFIPSQVIIISTDGKIKR